MIDIQNLSYDVGTKVLFENVNLKINPNDKIALVGLNGTGKSTFLKLLSDHLAPTTGKINKSKNLKIGYLPQEFLAMENKPLIEEVSSALKDFSSLEEKEFALTKQLENNALNESEREKLVHELGSIHHLQEVTGFFSKRSMIEKVLIGLGFTLEDFSKNINEFSGGWQMRAEMAKILLGDNDLILLDEPTNHLDIDSLRWLINYLKIFKGALLLISHDKYFLDEITSRTFEIWNNNIVTYNDNYTNYLNYKKQLIEEQEQKLKNQQKKISETEKFIERFRYKASKASQVQSRVKQLEKIKLEKIPTKQATVKIKFPTTHRGGSITLKMENVAGGYDSNIIFEDINFTIERNDKIGIVGKNGAGKSTLAKIAAKKLEPVKGDLIFGHNIHIAYFAQELTETLNLEDDLVTTLSKYSSELTTNELRNVLGAFLFSGDDIFKKVTVLSGGEKSRLALATILVRKSNFIILDEPTNHLDIISKEILQNALAEFNGSMLIISHDIDFLRPIVNKVIEFKNGRLNFFSGGIDYYLEKTNQEEKFENIKTHTPKTVETPNRKLQKKLEAEKRQKKYKATKELKNKITLLEKNIGDLEMKISLLESELTNSSTYQTPLLAKEKTHEYNETKKLLNSLLDEWTSVNEQLEKIESEFKNNLI